MCIFVQPQQQNSNLSVNALASLAAQPTVCSTPPPPNSTSVGPNIQHMSQLSTPVSAGNQTTTTHVPHPPSALSSSPNIPQPLAPLPQPEPSMQTQQTPSEQAQHPATPVRLTMSNVYCAQY